MTAKLVAGAAVSLFIAAMAASPAAFATPQQEKMKSCNAEAKTKSLAGDERKAFMKSCLSAGGAEADGKSLTPQQQKMKSCNAEAKSKNLAGGERKKFMSTCLKG